MARTDNLNNFLTDVADSIREKKGTTELIPASEFDTEIDSISSGVDINDYYDLSKRSSGTANAYIKKFPEIDTSEYNATNSMFANFSGLIEPPKLDTSKVVNMSNMFNRCTSLSTVPKFDTSKVADMSSMFYGCSKLSTIPQLDTSNVYYIDNMFYGCTSLKTIPELDTSKVTTMYDTFGYCYDLEKVPQLNAQNVNNVSNTFINCYELSEFGGLLNLGQAYSTSINTNNYNNSLRLNDCPKLTHDSLLNVINGLYDIKTKGCNPQELVLRSENLAKLTSEEIAIATDKGWTVS